MVLLALATSAAAAGIDGTYLHARDSDGTTPKKNATVSITFKPGAGGVSMRAVQPGETVTDSGSYSLAGDKITIRFREMEWEANRQGFAFDGCTLTLPFKALAGSPGAGTSKWLKQSPECAQKVSNAASPPAGALAAPRSAQAAGDTVLAAAPKQPAAPLQTPKPLPTSSRPTCERCDHVPCIKAMIAQKEKLRDIYGRLAKKYAKFYTAVANDGTRTPIATIDRVVWDRSSGGRIGGLADLLERHKVFMDEVENVTAEAPAPPECHIDESLGREMSTNPFTCETKAAPGVEAALPCRELWHSVVRHEALHSQECEKRRTGGENHGPTYVTPYGLAKEEMAAYAQEIGELTELLKRAENTCWFTCRCGGKKYRSAQDCKDNCRVGLNCPASAANSCMAPNGPDGEPAPIVPPGLRPGYPVPVVPLR